MRKQCRSDVTSGAAHGQFRGPSPDRSTLRGLAAPKPGHDCVLVAIANSVILQLLQHN